MKQDWNNEINFNEDYSDLREEFLDMMWEFPGMWEYRLGAVRKLKNSIETDLSDDRTIRSATYSAENKAREFKKEEIEQLVSMNAAELHT